MLRRCVRRLAALVTRTRRQSELDEEIRFHLSEEADERAADGLPPDRARAAARRDFGNVAAIREATRDAWGWTAIERGIQDARCALRMARRDPGLSAVAVLTLALGIGATAAIVNVVHALVLRSLPFPEADRLVVLFATTPSRGVYRDTTSFFDFLAWKNESGAFESIAAYRLDRFNITGDGPPEPLRGVRASEELLAVLRVRPLLGRTFTAEEQHGAARVALISHGLWTRRFGSDPGILGRSIALSETSYVVIGVLPQKFEFLPFQDTDLLLPVPERDCRSCGYVRAVARLKPETPAATAQQALDVVAARLALAFPESNQGRGVSVVPLHEVSTGQVRTPLLVLLGAGVCVLLIGCGNVGNLVLARGIARQRELAVRSALGAGAGRLVRQLLTESVALAVLAAVLGAGLAIAGSRVLVATLSERFPLPDVPFDWRLLGFVLLIAVASGLLSGAPPALMAWRADLSGALKQDSRSCSEGAPQHRLRNLLVVGQTALTVMLLVGAGLLVKSFVLLQRVDIGLDPRNVLSADLLLSTRYADRDRRDLLFDDLLASIGRIPGVRHAAVHTDSLFDGGGRQETFTIEGRPDPGPRHGHAARSDFVDGGFFPALGMRLTRGRTFDGGDTRGSRPVAIVNETLARTFWPDQDPLGRRLRLYYDEDKQRWLTVVGVAADAQYRYDQTVGPSGPPPLIAKIFLPLRQHALDAGPVAANAFVSVIVRTAGEPTAIAASLRSAIWAVDKDQPILTVHSMEEILWQSVAAPRIYTLLLGIFAAIALVIASAGIYGVGAYAVVRRTREIGIRLAVGASPRQMLALILRQGLSLMLAGVAAGVAGSLALARVTAGLLYGVTPTDIPTLLGVVALFAVVAFASIYVPARRAASIDPTLAFRYE